MSYESALSDLYNKMESEKRRKEVSRALFRQSVLDRQQELFKGINKSEKSRVIAIDAEFIMPEELPSNIDQLKWLIFQNISMINSDISRKKEGQANIKKIKDKVLQMK